MASQHCGKRNTGGLATVCPPSSPGLPPARGQEPAGPARPRVQAEQREVNAARDAEGSGHTFPISANGSHVAASPCKGLEKKSLPSTSPWKTYICEQSGGPAGLREFLEPQQTLNGEGKSPGQQHDQFLSNVFSKRLCMTFISQCVSPGLVVRAPLKIPTAEALFHVVNQRPSTRVEFTSLRAQAKAVLQRDEAHTPCPGGLCLSQRLKNKNNIKKHTKIPKMT